MSDLSKEMENGRLLRLLIKLGFVNERPEGDMVRRGGGGLACFNTPACCCLQQRLCQRH